MPNKHFINNVTNEIIISKLSQEEIGKRQYYRPVYSLHKWWARRSGAQFRSIILLANLHNKNIFKLDSKGNLDESSNYFQKHNFKDIILLDPFMGGGTTLAEANRLGLKVVGCDINPVSYWIVRETLKPINIAKLEYYFHLLEQNVGKEIRTLYQTNCGFCKTENCDSLYTFWVRTVNCPHCGVAVPLYKRTLLNEGLSRTKEISDNNPATAFCPKCYSLNDWFGGSCECKKCGFSFSPESGTYDQGFFSCPNCKKERISLVQTLKNGQKLKEQLIAIEYFCQLCKKRLYKTPDENDNEKITKINRAFDESVNELIFPHESILKGSSSVRWRQHNFNHYYEVFNKRQLIAFTYLINAIKAIPEEEYRNAFITIFSNSLEYNNMMTPYNYPHRKLHHLFNYHALPLTTTPVENSVWGACDDGAGTYVNCYKRYLNAKKYCQNPYDKYKDDSGDIHTIYTSEPLIKYFEKNDNADSVEEKIAANFVTSFNELKRTDKGAYLLCGDSSNLPSIPDKSIDFVITDPPYFDNIHYSELSNFFYVWLKCLTNDSHFIKESVDTEAEAIVNEGMNKSENSYQTLLTSVFTEGGRTLKDDGMLIFTFHHTKWLAWWTILSAIANSGFNVIDYFPVMSEYKVNPHIRTKQALDMDLVIICKKKINAQEPISILPDDIIKNIKESFSLNGFSENNNILFLHFIGELLKAASLNWGNEKITFEWFENMLNQFDAIKHIK